MRRLIKCKFHYTLCFQPFHSFFFLLAKQFLCSTIITIVRTSQIVHHPKCRYENFSKFRFYKLGMLLTPPECIEAVLKQRTETSHLPIQYRVECFPVERHTQLFTSRLGCRIRVQSLPNPQPRTSTYQFIPGSINHVI